MAKVRSQRPKKHPLEFMMRHSPDMDTFPSPLWMEPWPRGYENPDPVVSEQELPGWMSPAARRDIMAIAPDDLENNARWWVNLWERHPEPHDKELLFVATAMAARMGWPNVVQNLIDRGAPLVMRQPDEGWKWLSEEHSKIKKSLRLSTAKFSVLDLCVWSMKGYTAVSPLHDKQVAALDVLFENGARVEDIQRRTAIELTRHEPLGKWFIAHGLRGDMDTGNGQVLLDELFVQFPKISPNVHGRLLTAFIDQGLPVRFAENRSLPQFLAQTVGGLTQMHRLAVHPDRSTLSEAIKEALPQIEKRKNLRNAQDQKAFQEAFEVMVLELDTPQAQAVRARARL